MTAAATIVAAAACNKSGTTVYTYSTGPHWPARVVAPVNTNGFMVTTNNLSDTVSWLDLKTMAGLLSLPAGLNPVELEGPHHLVASPDGQYLYVGLAETFPLVNAGPHGAHGSGTVDGYLLKIRVADGALVGRVRVDRNPGDLIINKAGTLVFVSHFDVKRIQDNTPGPEAPKYSGIFIVQTSSMTAAAAETFVCPAEHGMALSPDERTLYVACYGNDSVGIVDVSQPAATVLPHTVVPVGSAPGELFNNPSAAYQPYAATLSSDGRVVWLSCWQSSDIRALIVSSGQMDLTRTVGPLQGIQGYGVFPTFGDRWGKKTVIAAQTNTQPFYEDALYVLDSNGRLSQTIQLDPQCVNGHAVKALPAEPDHAVVVCEGNHLGPGSLLKVDLPTGAILATAQVGVFPDGVAFVPPPGGF